MEESNQYYILNEKGEYFVRNDFNGKAYFLAPYVDGSIPITCFLNGLWHAEKKIFYLKNYGSGFKTLELKEYEKPIQIQQGDSGVSES